MVRYYGFAFALLGVIALFVGAGLYGAIASSLPKLPDLTTYAADAPGVTTGRRARSSPSSPPSGARSCRCR